MKKEKGQEEKEEKKEKSKIEKSEEQREQKKEEKTEEIIKLLREQIKERDRVIEEYKELLQRLKAEFDNYKKRVIRENEERSKLANEALINDLLIVCDSMDHALSSIEEILKNNPDNSAINSIFEGVNLVYKKFKEILKSYGLEEINPENEEFNPETSEAIAIEESEEYKKPVVIEVIQKGYKLSGKLLRPARVKVGKPQSMEEKSE